MSREQELEEWVDQGFALFEKRENEDAEKKFERVLRYSPGHERALLGLSLMYVSTGRGPLALKKLRQSQKENPDKPGPYRAISTVLRISGHLELGETYFMEVLETAPQEVHLHIYLGLAEIYAALGNHDKLRSITTALNAFPDFEPLTQGLLLMEISDSNGIFSLSQKVKGESLIATLQGMVAEVMGDMQTASQFYFKASQASDPTWVCLNALAALWLNNNNLENCKTYLSMAEAIAPNVSEVKLTRARYLRAKGKNEEAKKLLQQIAEGRGNFQKVQSLAAKLLG